MTAETITTPSVDAIDTALAAAAGSLGEDEQRLAVAVLRLLAAGAPVSIPAGAAAAGLRLGSARLGRASGCATASVPHLDPHSAAARLVGARVL